MFHIVRSKALLVFEIVRDGGARSEVCLSLALTARWANLMPLVNHELAKPPLA